MAGVATAALAVRWGFLEGGDAAGWLRTIGITLFFSLYPDLDTASVPQRWFYRVVFGILLYLSWCGEYRQAAVLAIVAILPLLDHHRGWTHWRVSPLLVVVLPAFGLAYWGRSGVDEGRGSDAAAVAMEVMSGHGLEIVAALVGWYVHLLMDGRFKLFPSGRDYF